MGTVPRDLRTNSSRTLSKRLAMHLTTRVSEPFFGVTSLWYAKGNWKNSKANPPNISDLCCRTLPTKWSHMCLKNSLMNWSPKWTSYKAISCDRLATSQSRDRVGQSLVGWEAKGGKLDGRRLVIFAYLFSVLHILKREHWTPLPFDSSRMVTIT